MKVMANSIPKSGTHMLIRMLALLGFKKSSLFVSPQVVHGRFSAAKRLLRGPKFQKDHLVIGSSSSAEISRVWLESRIKLVRNGAFFGGHCVYTAKVDELLRRNRVRMISIFRDPRDVAVSYMYYVKQSKTHYLHKEFMGLSSDYERLLFSIQGGKLGEHTVPTLTESYSGFLRWHTEGSALLVRFEDLVGEKGGGHSDVQRCTIERVSNFLDLGVNDSDISYVQENLFGASGTFRKGQIESWRSEFSEEHKMAAKEEAGELLIELGYEKDERW